MIIFCFGAAFGEEITLKTGRLFVLNVSEWNRSADEFKAAVESVFSQLDQDAEDANGYRVLVVADNPKACKQIHLPLQSGNDRILGLMNRTAYFGPTSCNSANSYTVASLIFICSHSCAKTGRCSANVKISAAKTVIMNLKDVIFNLL